MAEFLFFQANRDCFLFDIGMVSRRSGEAPSRSDLTDTLGLRIMPTEE